MLCSDVHLDRPKPHDQCSSLPAHWQPLCCWVVHANMYEINTHTVASLRGVDKLFTWPPSEHIILFLRILSLKMFCCVNFLNMRVCIITMLLPLMHK